LLDAGGALVPRNKYLLIIAVLTIAIGFPEAIGAIELPFAGWVSHFTSSTVPGSNFGNLMSNYGYASLFALMMLESASLPIPSELVLPLAGYLVSVGLMSFWLAVAVSTVASLTGALVDYYLAIWLGRPFVLGLLQLFGLRRGLLDRAENWFRWSGQWTVFVARFIPGLRSIISIPAGLLEMPIRIFTLLTVAGCFAWSVVLIYAGLLAGTGYGGAFNSATAQDGIAAVLAVAGVVYVAYYALPFLKFPTRPVSPASGS